MSNISLVILKNQIFKVCKKKEVNKNYLNPRSKSPSSKFEATFSSTMVLVELKEKD
jgi:hypothetical protein